jgi:transposase
MLDKWDVTAALGLAAPWYLANIEIHLPLRQIHIGVAYAAASDFPCPRCGDGCPAELDWPRTWIHEAFFGCRTYLHTRLPDLGCERCGIVPASVTWEREACGFVLLQAGRQAPPQPPLLATVADIGGAMPGC